ncbi:hypothetical protein GCM10028791_38400 [Echinicola sediminis]
MKAYIIAIILWSVLATPLCGQAYRTTEASVSFFSSAPLEDIKADNEEVIGVFNAATGAFAFVVQIKGFEFAKSLMQQHFNENFMESDKYPRATFEGRLTGYDLNASGKQNARAKGKMIIHGVEQEMEINGELEVKDGLRMKAVFPVLLADHNIEIPKILFKKIAEEVEVTVDFKFKKD